MRSALRYPASNSTSSGGFVENAPTPVLTADNTNETKEKEKWNPLSTSERRTIRGRSSPHRRNDRHRGDRCPTAYPGDPRTPVGTVADSAIHRVIV